MKNKIKVFGIIAIIALIGSFSACEEEKEKDGITISGTPKIGSIITVKINGSYWEGPYWEISADGVDWGDFISTQTSNYILFFQREKEITIPEDEGIVGGVLGHYIRASVQRTVERGSDDYSNVIGQIEE
jgi:hypothetical protein